MAIKKSKKILKNISGQQPHLLCAPGDIAPYVILPGDPGRVLRIAELLDNPREISFNREYRVVTGKYRGIPITICSSGIGGPAAAIAIEELNNLGARYIIRVGSCGASQAKIQVGDLIISDSVIREDHTALDYVPLSYPAVADRDIVNGLVTVARESGVPFWVGTTVSVDALYAPHTKEIKNFWREFGALAQDMEASLVITLCRLRGIKAGVILLVVDREAEKNVKEKIVRYSLEARAGQGGLIAIEKKAGQIALETFYFLAQEK